MLTLDASLRISTNVIFTVVGQDAFLLNTRTNKYYALEEVGVRLWELLNEGRQLRGCYQLLLNEYEVDPPQLERDILELIGALMENGLVEVIEE
ncbi:MAG: PqqD family protein [Chloroflexi bacterium]|nr:PqqD family protein [Chloroflexota bacterium]